MVALSLLCTATSAGADDAPHRDHLAISAGPFVGYLTQLDVHATVLLLQPLIFEAMWFRGWASFWPDSFSLPRDGGGASVGLRIPVFEKGRFEGFASGLLGYRAVLITGFRERWSHGMLCGGVVEALFRIGPRLAVGLRGSLGVLFFPGNDAPYFTYYYRLPTGGFAPEWQLGVEAVF